MTGFCCFFFVRVSTFTKVVRKGKGRNGHGRSQSSVSSVVVRGLQQSAARWGLHQSSKVIICYAVAIA